MLTLESLRDISKIYTRVQEIEFYQILNYIKRLKQTYEFEMNNDWQVRKELMKPVRYIEKEFSRRYIEYLLIGGTEYKTFYFNLDRLRNRVDLIDGRRRILAIMGYLNNNLEVFNGYKYEDFSDRDKERLNERIKFSIRMVELREKIEILNYYNILNFYRENEILNNMIFLDRLPKELINNRAIEIGTGREVSYWEYKGNVMESIPIPEWVKKEMLLKGEIFYRDNHWIEKDSGKEIKEGYYLYDNIKIKIKEKEIFNQYYLIKGD